MAANLLSLLSCANYEMTNFAYEQNISLYTFPITTAIEGCSFDLKSW